MTRLISIRPVEGTKTSTSHRYWAPAPTRPAPTSHRPSSHRQAGRRAGGPSTRGAEPVASPVSQTSSVTDRAVGAHRAKAGSTSPAGTVRPSPEPAPEARCEPGVSTSEPASAGPSEPASAGPEGPIPEPAPGASPEPVASPSGSSASTKRTPRGAEPSLAAAACPQKRSTTGQICTPVKAVNQPPMVMLVRWTTASCPVRSASTSSRPRRGAPKSSSVVSDR